MSEKNNQTRLRYFGGRFIASVTKPENLKEIFASGDRDALAVYAPVSMDEATAFNLFPEIATSREAILKSTRSLISIDRTTGDVSGNIEGVSNEKISKTVEYADNNGTYVTPHPERPVRFSVFKSESLSIVQSQDFATFGVEVGEDGSIIGAYVQKENLLNNTPDGTYTYTDGGENIAKTFEVTVQNVNGTNVYFIDGVEKPSLDLVRGGVYTFDQSAASNANHPLRFRISENFSETDGVSWEGTPGQTGAKTVFTVPSKAPNTLEYYCTNHPATMGNTVTITTGSTETFVVRSVANPNQDQGGAVYEITFDDGTIEIKPQLSLVRGGVYTFDVSHASNATHPLRFRVGGPGSDPFTDGVSWEGTQGTAGATVVFTVPNNAPDTLEYYCNNHPLYMGNTVTITTEPSDNTGSGLEFTFEIETTVSPMGTSRSITNITIVNAGTGYLSDEQITWRMSSGEYIVEETLTDGTWTIPAEELEEDYYYTFSFTQGNIGDGDPGDARVAVEAEPREIFQDSATYQAITIRKGNRFEVVPRNQRFNLAADDVYTSTDLPKMLFTADPDKSVVTAEGMEFQIDGSREVAGGEEGVIGIQYEGSATTSLDDSMKNPDIRFPSNSVGNIRPVDVSLENLSKNLVVYLTKEIVLSETVKLDRIPPEAEDGVGDLVQPAPRG